MSNNETDRRIGKTKRTLQEALFSLMQEKQYNKITIQDIIDRADVGRSTFYSHYETKDDLLMSSIEHLLEMLNQYIIGYLEVQGDTPRLLPVTELFDHIKENSKIMKGLIKADSSELLFNKMQVFWNKSIEAYLQTKMTEGEDPQIPLVVLTNHITSTLISLLRWWMNNKMPYSSAQMDQYFQLLINPCIDSILPKSGN